MPMRIAHAGLLWTAIRCGRSSLAFEGFVIAGKIYPLTPFAAFYVVSEASVPWLFSRLLSRGEGILTEAIPAAVADWMPMSVSSKTRQSFGATPRRVAATR